MKQILADAEAPTMILARVTEVKRPTHVPRHSFEAAMEARALIADRQAAKEQQR